MKHNKENQKESNLPMINFIQECIEKLFGELSQYEKLRVNAENEYQAMSCGAFNPRFLAMIKKSKVDNRQ